MLPGAALPNSCAHKGFLDELGTGPHEGNDFHAMPYLIAVKQPDCPHVSGFVFVGQARDREEKLVCGEVKVLRTL